MFPASEPSFGGRASKSLSQPEPKYPWQAHSPDSSPPPHAWPSTPPPQRSVFAALAHTGAWLNLLNLIPVWILDGGQATNALSRLQRVLLLATCLVFYILTHQMLFLLVAAGMTYRLFTRDLPTQPSTRTMVFYTTMLFLLAALLKIVPNQPINHF